MSRVTVRTSSSTVVFPNARAELVESQRSEHVPDAAGEPRLTVVERRATWTITCPARVNGWPGGVIKAKARPGERAPGWEYAINADLVDEVTVVP
jgi:hypothetical protein